MKHSIPAGEFKVHCLKLLDEVNQSRTVLLITKHGKPVAQLVPMPETKPTSLFGCQQGTVLMHDNIITSTGETWEAET
ncbi:MAG: prevent-host-death protein [Gammaproteobacteria bacterium RIFCSPHIGHO2_12_FULL_45_9]|nr:MAG: prevent-host-death protein [Gammaproteobacteria bacterium RIFCSPHIGHO2_12_FULL_45_9]